MSSHAAAPARPTCGHKIAPFLCVFVYSTTNNLGLEHPIIYCGIRSSAKSCAGHAHQRHESRR
jgi:hypothetical protein